MADNDYAEGTLEWHAWGRGFNYGELTSERDEPLSGEFAGDPLPHVIISRVWTDVLGESWDTYSDGDEDDRDQDSDILDAWEEGYRAAYGH